VTPREPTHKFYVDDSGTKEYAPVGSYKTKGGGVTPYFVFGGLLITPATAGVITHRMQALKAECFGAPDVEIKANWLRIPKERERRYLQRFGTTDERLRRFVDDTYGLIAAVDCTLLAAIVVKEQVQQRYGDRCFYAPAIAYECLAQRVQMEMSRCGGRAHVTVDDMHGATPKGKQYRTNLERHHKRLVTSGSMLQRGMVMDRLAGISFADSRADERLQLADLVSYAVYRQFVDNPEAWDSDAEELPTYEYLGRLAEKFRTHDGVLAGFGIVKFPTVSKRRWAVKKEKP
jgi:hypothetical protein